MIINGIKHYRLHDRHNTGYAGYGQGGKHLFSVCLVDCMDPPRYMVRADNLIDAYEVAEECLLDDVDSEHLAPDEAEDWVSVAYEESDSDMFKFSPSGRIVWADQDIRCTVLTAAFNWMVA